MPTTPEKSEAPASATVLQREIERAKSVSEKLLDQIRKPVPKGITGTRTSDYIDPRQDLVQRYVPEADTRLGEKRTKSTYFDWPGDKGERHKRHLAEGWIPVVADGEQVMHGQDLMYWRPREISDYYINQADSMSRERMKSFDSRLAEGEREGMVIDRENSVTGPAS